jgi:hypothetical protein
MSETPWEPPLSGTEVDHLLGALDRLRTTFRWKADDLDAAGLSERVGASTLTLGGLLKHLARGETMRCTADLDGTSPGEPWVSEDRGSEWHLDSSTPPEVLYELYDRSVAQSRRRIGEALAAGGLGQRVALGAPDLEVSLRRLLYDLLEEYGRHTGHADLLREAVDGRVGEDPPAGWRAVSGQGIWP